MTTYINNRFFYCNFAFVVISLLFVSGANSANDGEFEVLYQSWLKACKRVSFSSSSYDYVKLEEFQLIIKKGIPVLPKIVEKIQNKSSLESLCLMTAIESILHMRFSLPKNGLTAGVESNVVKKWWEEERFKSGDRFLELYQKWVHLAPDEKMKRPFTFDWDQEYRNDLESRRVARKQWMQMPEGPEKERMRPYNRTVYQRLLDLGIPALPYAVEVIKKGDKNLLEAVNLWTDSSLQEYASQKNKNLQSLSEDELKGVVAQWWEENQEKYKLPD